MNIISFEKVLNNAVYVSLGRHIFIYSAIIMFPATCLFIELDTQCIMPIKF